MKFKLFDTVSAVVDLPDCGVKAGAIGAVVETFTKPQEAYFVEFADAPETTDFPAVLPDQLELHLSKEE